MLKNWKMGPRTDINPDPTPPTLPEFGAAELFFTVAAIEAGVVDYKEQAEELRQQARDLAMAQAKAASPPPPPPPPPGSSSTGMLKMSAYCNQTGELGPKLLDEAGIRACYNNYNAVFRIAPEPIREATIEQLSIGARYKSTAEKPFCDYAALTPIHQQLGEEGETPRFVHRP